MENSGDLTKQAIEDAVKNDMEKMFGPARQALDDVYFKESLNTMYGLMKAHYEQALANGFEEKQGLTIIAKMVLGVWFGQ